MTPELGLVGPPLIDSGAAQKKQSKKLWLLFGPLAAVATAALVASFALSDSFMFTGPYPDEKTPLSLQTWGVSLTIRDCIQYNLDEGFFVESTYISFGEQTIQDGSLLTSWTTFSIDKSRMISDLADYDPVEDLDWFVSRAVVGESGEVLWECIGTVICDANGDGWLTEGDSISLSVTLFNDEDEPVSFGFPENEEHILQLTAQYHADSVEEASFEVVYPFGFAVNDGRLFSWEIDQFAQVDG